MYHNTIHTNYTSCIKIAGIPILPPLITPEKCQIFQEYKKRAIEIEAKLKVQKEKKSRSRTLENSLVFDTLNISDDLQDCDDSPNNTNVPLADKLEKTSKLTVSIFDVTQYNDNGVTLFNNHKTNNISLSASTVELNLTNSICDEQLPRPRMLRSNSYTLESPSPILLEHFRKQQNNEQENYLQLEEKLDSQMLDDFTITTVEADNCQGPSLSNVRDSEFNSTKSTLKTDDCDISHSIDINCLESTALNTKHEEASLQEMLALMPEDYAKDIMNMFERHKNESQLIIQNQFINDDLIEDQLQYTKEVIANQDNLTDSLNVLSTSPSILLIDLESDDAACDTCNVLPCEDACHSENHFEILNCNSESFYRNSNKANQKLKEQWAGTILTAAAKGYLIRRLKRTVRVQDLIQTIRDALVCAMSLHKEQTDSIQPSDVELHRRLIQQISAACYEFYDIFFTLTIKEQMAIIAQDRQRLREKLKRPNSASSLKLQSERSTPGSQKKCFGTKQKKNLVPSFAA